MSVFEIIVLSYFLTNMFLAGHYFACTYKWCENRNHIIGCVVITIMTIVVGLPWFAILSASAIAKMFNETFQINFFFSYVFTKRWHNMDVNRLSMLNKIAGKKDVSKLSGRIFIKCVQLMNNRNNYTYTKKES